MSGAEADIKIGNALPLINIPAGTVVHNIELKPGRGGQLVRPAGCVICTSGLVKRRTKTRKRFTINAKTRRLQRNRG